MTLHLFQMAQFSMSTHIQRLLEGNLMLLAWCWEDLLSFGKNTFLVLTEIATIKYMTLALSIHHLILSSILRMTQTTR